MNSNPNVAILFRHFESRSQLKDEQWLEGVEDRKRQEVLFHNLDRERADETTLATQHERDIYANRKYYEITRSSVNYVDRWLKVNVPGKVFLDYACGNGVRAIQAAKLGAALSIGIDISDVSIGNAQRDATALGLVRNCRFAQGDCENTELPDRSIDVVLCSGMLHHLDLNRAFAELDRILAPGGRILAVEALAHNPAIKLYRKLTPHLRTAWETEHIVKVGDLRIAELRFRLGQVRYWHLFALAAVVLRKTFLFNPCLASFEWLDSLVLGIPGVNRLAWQITFELLKKQTRPDLAVE